MSVRLAGAGLQEFYCTCCHHIRGKKYSFTLKTETSPSSKAGMSIYQNTQLASLFTKTHSWRVYLPKHTAGKSIYQNTQLASLFTKTHSWQVYLPKHKAGKSIYQNTQLASLFTKTHSVKARKILISVSVKI